MGNLWLPLMVGLGSTIGIFMGLTYPFPLYVRFGIILALLLSVIAVYFGFKYGNKVWGQALAVIGVAVWVLIGVVGLSTGT